MLETLRRFMSRERQSKADRKGRRLILVPITHSLAELGSLGPQVKDAYVNQYGAKAWQKHSQLVGTFWPMLRKELDNLRLDYQYVNLYVDSLGCCGEKEERQVVEEQANKGNETYSLVIELADRGATLLGTEDMSLLLEEYKMNRRALAGERVSNRTAADLLAKRDAYIGQRISETLHGGWSGILFLGIAHDVERHLAKDIVVTRFKKVEEIARNDTLLMGMMRP
jgi:hypothetical protein